MKVFFSTSLFPDLDATSLNTLMRVTANAVFKLLFFFITSYYFTSYLKAFFLNTAAAFKCRMAIH